MPKKALFDMQNYKRAHVQSSFIHYSQPSNVNKPPSFKFYFNNVIYLEKSDNNHIGSFHKIEPYDQLAYGEELYLLSTSRINDLLNGVQRGLPLHMSEEQVESLNTPGPTLISGEAGSGKTIIITHWLMINHLRHSYLQPPPPPISQLFVTLSSRLRDNAETEFEKMLPKTHLNNNTHFLTFHNLVEEIAREAGILHQFQEEKEITFERFMKDYARRIPRSIDPVLLWDEIRSVIKGSGTKESQSFIDLPSYERLSDERGQCKTPKNLRKDYYNAAREYQNHLLEDGLWDKLDMVKSCLPHLDTARKYEKIACDEVQDLAPIEILLLTRLIKNDDVQNLFLTGDRAQVINPSGFRWSQVKGLLGQEFPEKKIPDVHVLRRNYRSCLDIVELANSVLAVRRDVLNDSVSKLNQEPLLPSRILPMILRKPKDDLLIMLKKLESNPDQRLILVKTSEQKEVLKEKLGAALENNTLLTVEEAKGLEYEGALLWNFFIPRHSTITKNDWENIFVSQKREKMKEEIQNGTMNPYALTYEFNLLHVGLTRARRLLFVFDENEKMSLPLLGEEVENKVTKGDLKDFKTNWETQVPRGEDLYNAGIRLLERDTEQAYHFFKLAAKAYEKQNDLAKAAQCCEKALDYDAAARLYRTDDDKINELRVLGEKHKNLQDWDRAGRFFMKLGQLQIDSGMRKEASQSFIEARDSYHNAKNKMQASQAAFKSAECLPFNYHIEKAELYNKVINWAINTDDKIRSQENAIQEAQEARRGDMQNIQGEVIDAWIAKRYYTIANLERERENFKDGAVSAKRAAGLWKILLEKTKYVMNHQNYQDSFESSLALSVELYIKSGETTKSITQQKELLESLNQASVSKIQPLWISFADLYLKGEEEELYVETTLELAKFLSDRKEHSIALRELKKAEEKCQALNLSKITLKLADKHINIAQRHGEWEELAIAHEIYATTYETKGDFLNAWNHYKEAGKALLKAEKIISAEKSFTHGQELYSKIITPSEVGWYCFNDVVMEGYLLIEGKLYENVLKWIKESATFFSQDLEVSMIKLNGFLEEISTDINRYIKKLKETTSPTRKNEFNKMLNEKWEHRGWVEVCIALTQKAYADLTSSDSMDESVNEWINKALSSFENVKNSEAISLIKKL